MKYQPYTYLIGWSKLDKWYYGSETINTKSHRVAKPSNLWRIYFTSSKVVARYRLEFGEPDVIEIRRIFESKAEAVAWEHKVLKRLNAAKNSKWLNQHNGGKSFHGVGVTEGNHFVPPPAAKGDLNPAKRPEVRAKISSKLKGMKKTDAHKAAMSSSRKGFTSEARIQARRNAPPVAESTKAKLRAQRAGIITCFNTVTNEFVRVHKDEYARRKGELITAVSYRAQQKRKYRHETVQLS